LEQRAQKSDHTSPAQKFNTAFTKRGSIRKKHYDIDDVLREGPIYLVGVIRGLEEFWLVKSKLAREPFQTSLFYPLESAP
jgi:hypothetical protein